MCLLLAHVRHSKCNHPCLGTFSLLALCGWPGGASCLKYIDVEDQTLAPGLCWICVREMDPAVVISSIDILLAYVEAHPAPDAALPIRASAHLERAGNGGRIRWDARWTVVGDP